MKRIISLLLALVMVLSLGVVAFADDVPTGKITIKYAEVGQTYTLYRIFDGERFVDESGDTVVESISYYVTNAKLKKLIEDATGVYGVDADACPFRIQYDENGKAYIVHKDSTNQNPGRGWLYKHLEEWVDDAPPYSATAKVSDKGTLEFDVPYGYYLLMPTVKDPEAEGVVATVNSNIPSVVINDKNKHTPSEALKTEDKQTVIVGDEITYTASLFATNYNTESASYSAPILTYYIKDIPSEGLSFLGESENYVFGDENGTLKLYYTYNATTGEFEDLVEDEVPFTYDADTNTLEIPWADEDGNALYPSRVYIVATFKMTVNEHILDDPAKMSVTNKIHATFDYEKENGTPGNSPIPDPPEVIARTTAISIRKVDAKDESKTLDGATFVLYKLTDDNKELFYHWNDTTKEVEWIEEYGKEDIKEADNRYETMEFQSLKEGTYYLRELTAPLGYTPPDEDDPFVLVIERTTDGKFTATLDGEPVALQNTRAVYTVYIANGEGGALPYTGGEGTILMLTVGAILFLATTVVLVTKKRMYNEGR